MHIKLLQGLDFMEVSVIAHSTLLCRKLGNYVVMDHHCHKTGDTFYGLYESKTVVLDG